MSPWGLSFFRQSASSPPDRSLRSGVWGRDAAVWVGGGGGSGKASRWVWTRSFFSLLWSSQSTARWPSLQKRKKKKKAHLSLLWPPLVAECHFTAITAELNTEWRTVGRSDGRTDGQTSSHHPCVFVFPGGKTDGHRLSRRPFSLPSLSSPPLQPLPDLFCLFPILSSHGWRARASAPPPALCEAAKRFVFAETCAVAIDLLLIGVPVTFPLTLQSVKNDGGRRGKKKN